MPNSSPPDKSMDPKLLSILITVAGALLNSAWAYFNLRWEKRTSETITKLKEELLDWMEQHTYSRGVLDERHKGVRTRLDRLEAHGAR